MKTSVRPIFLFSALIAVTLVQAQTPAVVPPQDLVHNMTQAEWSRAWWQWAGSFQRKDSPVGDRTGALCDRGQGGPVWFLAGTYGSHRAIRDCKVPSGKYLFFPLINYVVMPHPGVPISCQSVMSKAAAMTDGVSALVLDIDGVRVPDLASYRQATQQCFDMGARSEEKISVFPSAANGYYMMLKPLSRGRHEINFGGALPSMMQAVTYTLDVE
ncbi:hypothetical protein LNV23_04445 [Paucibacter sp. DJ1R-11]|uniref:hypothetical protein n=1 Tax=Paucibacter sp. DJ1R-11 TaxID=2893556 RepID=UPI0021E46EEB|nr:hypothetical protein [Paucibacter sp. DJ1R-11]MCV2362698.1 hypothetical protein [Paucibacter sp. DJ1R-11]